MSIKQFYKRPTFQKLQQRIAVDVQKNMICFAKMSGNPKKQFLFDDESEERDIMQPFEKWRKIRSNLVNILKVIKYN